MSVYVFVNVCFRFIILVNNLNLVLCIIKIDCLPINQIINKLIIYVCIYVICINETINAREKLVQEMFAF